MKSVPMEHRFEVLKGIAESIRMDGLGRVAIVIYNEKNADRYNSPRGNSLIIPRQPQSQIREETNRNYRITYNESGLWTYTVADIPARWADTIAKFSLENGGHVTLAVDKITGVVLGASFSVPYGVVMASHSADLKEIVGKTVEYAAGLKINPELLHYAVDRTVATEVQGLGIGRLIVSARDQESSANGLIGNVTWVSDVTGNTAVAALQKNGYSLYAHGLGGEYSGETPFFIVERDPQRPHLMKIFDGSERQPLIEVIRP